jgi:alanine racemase
LVDLKWIEKGESVSYDGIWTAKQKSLIGVLPIGYGDGYPKSLEGNTFVWLKSKKAQVVGKICMDFMMIDLTDLIAQDNVESLSGETALIFGESSLGDSLPVEDLAERAGMRCLRLLITEH